MKPRSGVASLFSGWKLVIAMPIAISATSRYLRQSKPFCDHDTLTIFGSGAYEWHVVAFIFGT
jgi:hypothetical protein